MTSAGIAGDWLTHDQVEALGPVKGAYALVLKLNSPLKLDIAKFSGETLKSGWYVYLGSARGSGGLRARLNRHFQKTKTLHWHIDRLTVAADTHHALAVADGNECNLLLALLDRPELEVALPGFGSSDCRQCPSHLLRLSQPSQKSGPLKRRPPNLVNCNG